MPIYDYKCKECQYQSEYIVKDYLEVKECPKCKNTMQRQVASPSFRLYGKDWFKPNKR